MRTMRGIAWAAGVVVIAACGGDGDDATAPPADSELSCTNPATAGAAVTCSLTLPEEAGLRAVVTGTQTCEAEGNSFVFTAPEAATLTADGCFETVLPKEINLAGPYQSGTPVAVEFTPGDLDTDPGSPGLEGPGVAAVQVSGEYPQWTLNFEDAVAAFPSVPDDYDDLTVVVTVVPTVP
jgi:hypothetical protein